MADLAVLVPSRGRPGNVARLIEACDKTCRADTVLWFGFDHDDPQLQANLNAVPELHYWSVHDPRMGLAAWTNFLAEEVDHTCLSDEHGQGECKDVPFLASLGDDMVPVTDGWDERLIAACGPCGMAYPWDGRREDVPEAIVMDTRIVQALGWMCLPSLNHWYVDNVWADLGTGARCITYLQDVHIEHRHPNVPGGDKPDATYHDAAKSMAADMAAYQKWRLRGMRADVEKVRGAGSAG